MNDESKTPSNDADPEMGLATPDILKRWLEFETMTLWDAALIVHGASPDAGGLGLYESRRRAVEDTRDVLMRMVELTPEKGEGDRALYKTAKIFKEIFNESLSEEEEKWMDFALMILLRENVIELPPDAKARFPNVVFGTAP